MTLDQQLKKDFPIFKKHPRLVYLDSAASSQKPQAVIEAVGAFYQEKNANVHRGIYALAESATEAYEGVREKVREFINAKSVKEIVFVKNATEGINLVANSWKVKDLNILISQMEHHANIVPWQLNHSKIETIRLTNDFRLDLEDYKKKLNNNIKLVAITHASNVLGTINPIKEIIKLAHDVGAKVLIDGAQAVPHLKVDVQDLDADFYVFSGHKMLGPTGIGILYAKQELLEQMSPYQGGGEMISRVDFKKSEWNDLPWKFEAGTPNIAGVVGLGAAIDYIKSLGFDEIEKHENTLTGYALERLNNIEGLNLYGPPESKDRLSVFAFSLTGTHSHDVASLLDQDMIAVRAGNHCAMPLHTEVIKQLATARASLYIYNSKEDIDKLIKSIEKIIEKFS